MFSPFPTEEAESFCSQLMKYMDLEKRLDFGAFCSEDVLGKDYFEQNTADFSTEALFEKCGGQMFGVLVCRKSDGTKVVLKGFSGQYMGHYTVPGWVPPLLDTQAYLRQVQQDDGAIKACSAQIKMLLEQDEAENSKKILELKTKRKLLSRKSYEAICNLYSIPCVDGAKRSLKQIIPAYDEGKILPFTGTGDCCAPKLLGYAFCHDLFPLSLAEFYYGSENSSATRKHKCFYAPCDSKCGTILPAMLGLEILYQDKDIVVVNKPAGLLSVPGRSADMQDCVVNRLKRLFPDCIEQPSVHRLDMDTSGILVLALTKQAHRNLSIQFIEGSVHKEYEAVLCGKPCGAAAFDSEGNSLKEGIIKLPFRLDVENRPMQIYDEVYGKIGITKWQILAENVAVLGESEKCTRILFIPQTGRTHQLRLHSMHGLGLGKPIVGDRLYGTRHLGQRMMLHAGVLSFKHPITSEIMSFKSAPEF